MLEKKFDLFTCNIETLIIKVFGDVSVALKHAEALSEMSWLYEMEEHPSTYAFKVTINFS